MPYRYLEGITFADFAFEATGATLPELFNSAAQALIHLMLRETDPPHPQEAREFNLASTKQEPTHAAEELLLGFLEELVYLKDVKNTLFLPRQISLNEAAGQWRLEASLKGYRIDQVSHPLALGTDVKAITHHLFTVEQTPSGWRAVVVVDV